MAKLKDIAVVVGTYQQNGEEKFKWKTVGALIEGKGGKQYVMLDRTFNPAGVPDLEDRGGDQIVMSMFDPKGYDNASPKKESKPAPSRRFHEDDDDIPF